MTTPKPEATLVERLERLTGPDREMDCQIEAAIRIGFVAVLDEFQTGLSSSQKSWMVKGNHVSYFPPRYTASFDAAMTLVPEGRDWELLWITTDGPARAEAKIYTVPYMAARICDHEHYGEAATPVIALTLAAVKARNL